MAGTLRHAGVKGMKWGQRKAQPKASTEQVYEARKSVAKDQIKLRQYSHKDDYSVYSATKAASLQNRIRKNSKIAGQSVSKKETATKITLGAAVATGVLGYAGSKVASALPSGPGKDGAMIVSTLLSVGALGLSASTIATSASAAKDERDYYNSN